MNKNLLFLSLFSLRGSLNYWPENVPLFPTGGSGTAVFCLFSNEHI